MDFNEKNNQNREEDFMREDNPSLKEKRSDDHVIWYWIIAILILGLFGWYGYTAGWFTRDSGKGNTDISQSLENKQPKGVRDNNEASINNVTIRTSEDFPVRKTLVVKGDLDNACVYLNSPQIIRDGSTFYVNLTTREEGDNCSEVAVPYEREIELDVIGLPAGVYSVVINGKETTFELDQDNSIDFSSGEEK